ncbi:MAG: hypothetical protein E7361_01925 [Clostridiales bacterium]|nr:hypothetical protein [Clostridiales bacterium]
MARKFDKWELEQQPWSARRQKRNKQLKQYTKDVLRDLNEMKKKPNTASEIQEKYIKVWKKCTLEGQPVPKEIKDTLKQLNKDQEVKLPDKYDVVKGFKAPKYSIFGKKKQYEEAKKELNRTIKCGNLSEKELIDEYKKLIYKAIDKGVPIDENSLRALDTRKSQIIEDKREMANSRSNFSVSNDEYERTRDRLSFHISKPSKNNLAKANYKNNKLGISNFYDDQLGLLNYVYKQESEKHYPGHPKSYDWYKEQLDILREEGRENGELAKRLQEDFTKLKGKEQEVLDNKIAKETAEEEKENQEFRDRMEESFVKSKLGIDHKPIQTIKTRVATIGATGSASVVEKTIVHDPNKIDNTPEKDDGMEM